MATMSTPETAALGCDTPINKISFNKKYFSPARDEYTLFQSGSLFSSTENTTKQEQTHLVIWEHRTIKDI